MDEAKATTRVIVYIDGYNLYHGMKSKEWRRFYWLDIKKLASSLLVQSDELRQVRYFTTRISMPQNRKERQNTYLEAVETLSDVTIQYGRFQYNLARCWNCGDERYVPSEKKTDVNIAVDLLCDAQQNNFDKAYLVTADADLTAPILAVKQFYPDKRIVVAFPPNRSSIELQGVADAYLTIGRGKLASSQFADTITRPDGFVLERPTRWR